MENPLKGIPPWIFGMIIVVGGGIILLRTKIVQSIPGKIKEMFGYIKIELETEGFKNIIYKPMPIVQGTWAKWKELLQPLAGIAADAIDFLLKPFRLNDFELKKSPGWVTLFALGAVAATLSGLIGLWVKLQGFKPKAYYKDSFVPHGGQGQSQRQG